jgi:predicted DNA-binding transcriptional regulator AlpA
MTRPAAAVAGLFLLARRHQMDLSKFLRREEVADLAGTCTKTIDRLVSKGLCPAPFRFGSSVMFSEAEILRWLKSYRRWKRHERGDVAGPVATEEDSKQVARPSQILLDA